MTASKTASCTIAAKRAVVKGLSAGGTEAILKGREDAKTRGRGEYRSTEDLRERAQIKPDDLRLLIKVGACDSIGEGRTRPEMLWEMDAKARGREGAEDVQLASSRLRVSASPRLPEYSPDRRRREECDLLGFAKASPATGASSKMDLRLRW